MALTKSGPATILFYGLNGMTFADTDYDSGRTLPDVSSISIEEDQQLNDSVVRFERDQFELRTQASSKPCRYNTVGLEPMLELSIADIVFDNIKLAVGESGVLTKGAGANDSDKLSIEDNVGADIQGQRVQVLPVPYPTLYSANLNKGTNEEYRNPFHSEYTVLLTTGSPSAVLENELGVVGSDPSVAAANEFVEWRESIITFPNAAIVDINQIDLAFGLQTQQEIRVMLRGLPAVDDSGIRVIFGSLDVTS